MSKPMLCCPTVLSALLLFSGPVFAVGLEVELVDLKGKPLADAVVSLAGGAGGASPAGSVVMDQRDKQFAPSVLAVRTGTPVKFPNSDNIRHHVYSFSAPKRFELRLYEGTPSEPVVFDKPGVEVLGCNIHDWMLGYIYITDDPWFAVSDGNGRLRIDGLPAGTYKVTLWHPLLADMQPSAGGEVKITGADVKQQFTLQVADGATALAPSPPPSSGFGDAFKKATRDGQQ